MGKSINEQPVVLNSGQGEQWVIIDVPGDGNCGYYVFGVGLIENLYHHALMLKSEPNSWFFTIFGKEILGFDREATVEEVNTWVSQNYANRYLKTVYIKLEPVLRKIVFSILNQGEEWNGIVNKMQIDLIQMQNNNVSLETGIVEVDNFLAVFDASHLKEGKFGQSLREFLVRELEGQTSISSESLRQHLLTAKASYLQGVLNKAWISLEVELPILGKYFGINLFKYDFSGLKPIYSTTDSTANIQFEYNGIHFKLRTCYRDDVLVNKVPKEKTEYLNNDSISSQSDAQGSGCRKEVCNLIEQAQHVFSKNTSQDPKKISEKIIPLLKRISWRISEIPSQEKYAEKITKFCPERNWLVLEYMANVLNNLENSGLLTNSLELIIGDLISLKEMMREFEKALDGQIIEEKTFEFLNIEKLVNPMLDLYLLERIDNALQNLCADSDSEIKLNEFLKNDNNQRSILRVLEILGECSKCISISTRQLMPEIPWLSNDSNSLLNGVLQKIRNAIQHNRRKAERIFCSKKEISYVLIENVFPIIRRKVNKLKQILSSQSVNLDQLDSLDFQRYLIDLHKKLTESSELTNDEIAFLMHNILDKGNFVIRLFSGFEDLPDSDEKFIEIIIPYFKPQLSESDKQAFRIELKNTYRILFGKQINAIAHQELSDAVFAVVQVGDEFDFNDWRKSSIEYFNSSTLPTMGSNYLLYGLEKIPFLPKKVKSLLEGLIKANRMQINSEIILLIEHIRKNLKEDLEQEQLENNFLRYMTNINKKLKELVKDENPSGSKQNYTNALYKILLEKALFKRMLVDFTQAINYESPERLLVKFLNEEDLDSIIKGFEYHLDEDDFREILSFHKIPLEDESSISLFFSKYKNSRLTDDDFKHLVRKIPIPEKPDLEKNEKGFRNALMAIPRELPPEKSRKRLQSMLHRIGIEKENEYSEELMKNNDPNLFDIIMDAYKKSQERKFQSQLELSIEENVKKLKNGLSKDYNLEDIIKTLFYKAKLSWDTFNLINGKEKNVDATKVNKSFLDAAKEFADKFVQEARFFEKPYFLVKRDFSYQSILTTLKQKNNHNSVLLQLMNINQEELDGINFETLLNKLNSLLVMGDLYIHFDFSGNIFNIDESENMLLKWLVEKAIRFSEKGQYLPSRQFLVLNIQLLKLILSQMNNCKDQTQLKENDTDSIKKFEMSGKDGVDNAIKNIGKNIDKLSVIFERISLDPNNLSVWFSAEYLLEEIGQVGRVLVLDSSYQEAAHKILSKRNFHFLTVARKAIAHFPILLSDGLLKYYIDQLVLTTKFYLDEAVVKTAESDFLDLPKIILSRAIYPEELEKKRILIHAYVCRFGFKPDFKVFHRNFNTDVGIQGNLNLLVEFESLDKQDKYKLFDLELILSIELNADVKVYTVETFKQRQGDKVFHNDLALLSESQTLPDLLRTESYKKIFREQRWAAVTLPNIGRIRLSNFERRHAIENIFSRIEKTQIIMFEEVRSVLKNPEYLREIINEYLSNEENENTKIIDWVNLMMVWIVNPFVIDYQPISLEGEVHPIVKEDLSKGLLPIHYPAFLVYETKQIEDKTWRVALSPSRYDKSKFTPDKIRNLPVMYPHHLFPPSGQSAGIVSHLKLNWSHDFYHGEQKLIKEFKSENVISIDDLWKYNDTQFARRPDPYYGQFVLHNSVGGWGIIVSNEPDEEVIIHHQGYFVRLTTRKRITIRKIKSRLQQLPNIY